MSKSIFFIFLISLFQSCMDQQCKPEDKVDAFILSHFQEIQTCLDQTTIVSGKALLSISYLERITGINSSVIYGDVSYYESKKAYRIDRGKWKKWYKKNKCGLTYDKIENVKKELNALEHVLNKNE